MTSRDRVREVYPDAAAECWPDPVRYNIASGTGYYLAVGVVGAESRAWASAWRYIEQTHRESFAAVLEAFPAHHCIRGACGVGEDEWAIFPDGWAAICAGGVGHEPIAKVKGHWRLAYREAARKIQAASL